MDMETIQDLGETLRGLRLQKGLSLDDIAFRTKIRKDYLQALEDGRYDLLPAETYIRGFLVSYAAAVAHPAKEILEQYQSAQPAPERDDLTASAIVLSSGSSQGPGNRVLLISLFLVLLFAGGFGLWWFLPLNKPGPSAEKREPVTTAPAEPQKPSEPDKLVTLQSPVPLPVLPIVEKTPTPPQQPEETAVVESEQKLSVERVASPDPVVSAAAVEESVADNPAASPANSVEFAGLVLPQVMRMRAVEPVSVVVAIDGRPVQPYNLQAESLLRWRIYQSVVVEVEHAGAVEIYLGDNLVIPDESGRFVFPSAEE